MPAKPSALLDAELTALLATSRQVLSSAMFTSPDGIGLLASQADGPRPYVDIRTLAAAVVACTELGDFHSARAFCRYLLQLQGAVGSWPDVCDDQGRDVASGSAEDVTALAVWALLTYVRASGDESLAVEAHERVENAAGYIRARLLNPYLYLIETTGSLHGPLVSAGYDLWTNCAYAAAFALCHRVYGGDLFRRLALLIRRAIGQLLVAEGRYLRRLDPHGYPDPRPDIGLIAPYYFRLWHPSDRLVMNSAEVIERTLWNVETGGYVRFLPYSADERAVLPGVSPLFSGWMAQYQYELGNRDRADAILRWIVDSAQGGPLAETLISSAVIDRYGPEHRKALAAGLGGRLCLPGQEQRLVDDFAALEARAAGQRSVGSGAASVWAHLELLRVLRRGDYLTGWKLDPSGAAQPAEGQVP
jgi:hypothetical protein